LALVFNRNPFYELGCDFVWWSFSHLVVWRTPFVAVAIVWHFCAGGVAVLDSCGLGKEKSKAKSFAKWKLFGKTAKLSDRLRLPVDTCFDFSDLLVYQEFTKCIRDRSELLLFFVLEPQAHKRRRVTEPNRSCACYDLRFSSSATTVPSTITSMDDVAVSASGPSSPAVSGLIPADSCCGLNC
jgi:hypothetical protein